MLTVADKAFDAVDLKLIAALAEIIEDNSEYTDEDENRCILIEEVTFRIEGGLTGRLVMEGDACVFVLDKPRINLHSGGPLARGTGCFPGPIGDTDGL